MSGFGWFRDQDRDDRQGKPIQTKKFAIHTSSHQTTFGTSADRSCEVGFTGLFGAKITEREAHDVLDGKLPDGTEIPFFPFGEFKRGVAGLPRRYAVVMDFEMARKSRSGNETFDDLKDDPLMIVRAGGADAAAAYLDKARDRRNSTVMGNWHSFNDIDPDQPHIHNMARYVAVAPRNASTSLRNLDFGV